MYYDIYNFESIRATIKEIKEITDLRVHGAEYYPKRGKLKGYKKKR